MLLGKGATVGSVTDYARLASGSVYDTDAEGNVTTNVAVKKFVLKRMAAEKARLAKMLTLRKKQIALLATLRTRLKNQYAARGAHPKGSPKWLTISKNIVKTQSQIGACLGLIDYYGNEAMMLGGAIAADEEMLEPPEPSTGGGSSTDTGSGTDTGTGAPEVGTTTSVDANGVTSYGTTVANANGTYTTTTWTPTVGGASQWNTENTNRSKRATTAASTVAAGQPINMHWHVKSDDPMGVAREVAYIFQSGRVQLKAGMA
jgi:hypothetical protein